MEKQKAYQYLIQNTLDQIPIPTADALRITGLIKQKGKEASKKEQDQYTILQVTNEMMARGYEFVPIDIYKSDATRYLIEDGKIRLPFLSIAGTGEAAAKGLAAARDDGEGTFISKDDLQRRAGVSKSVIASLEETK